MGRLIADRERDVHTGPRGLRLRVSEWGPSTGRPVVILHGFLEQGPSWDAVARGLNRRVVAPDQRGHGLSDHVGHGGFYHFFDYVSDLAGLVRDLGQPVDLIGHSMGGTVACLFAGAVPDAVRRLALIEGLGPPDMSGSELARTRTFLEHMRDGPGHPVMPDLDDAITRMTRHARPAPPLARLLAERVTRPIEGGLTWTWDPLHRARSPRAFRTDNLTPFLDAVTAPTLVVHGATSWYLRMPDLAHREARVRARQRVVVDGAGHHLHHDAPDQLASILADFLD